MVSATERGVSLRQTNVESSAEFPHKALRPPSPPIRYELKTDSNTYGRYGIKRHRGRDKHEKPATRNEGSPTKTSPKASQAMKTKAPTRINRPRVRNDDDDDNMSLISMTNLIADDVCRLQNCRYENIGPNVTDGKSSGNHSAIIDMNVNVEAQRNVRQQNQTSKASKPRKHHSSSGVWVNKPTLLTDYQTSDTASMTTRSLSRSPQHSRRMMNVNYESDNISEITPPRCAAFDVGKSENSKSGQKQSNPEETFREFLSSVATCLPNAGDFQHVQKSFSDAQTKFEITNKHGLLLHSHIRNQNLCHSPNLCDTNHQGVVGNGNGKCNLKNIAGNNKNSMLLKHGRDILDSDSVTSASSLPYFRNNSDRYNHLVNGRELAYMQAANEAKQRKFSRSWFKARRESNKRRNNSNVVPPQQVSVSCQAPFDEPQGHCNGEGLWNQSRSFDENEKRLYSKATKQPMKGTKTPIFKKLLKRGKSKERRRLKQKDSGKHVSPTAARSVTITAKDPTKWPPEQKDALVSSCDDPHILEASKCVASTIVTAVASPGETAMNVLNSDVAMALVGAPPASAVALAVSNAKKREISQNRKIEDQKNKEPSNGEVAVVGPVWKTDERTAKPVLPSPAKTKPLKKSRPRCYHRNSDLMDDNFAPTLSWRKSRSYDSPTTSLTKSHSYSEDDFAQEDFKVVSIIGHDVSSTELERYGSMNLPHNGGMTNTLMSDRHQQVFAPSRPRNSGPTHRRNNSAGRYSNGNSSPTSFSSYSTSSSSDSSSIDETSSSSSSSAPKRPIRARSKPQSRIPRTRSVDAAIMNDADDEYTSGSDAALEAALLTTPWRKDYETHMASKGYKSGSAVKASPIGPLEPPKIQRTALPNANIPRISPPRKDIPMRRLLV